MKNVVAASLSKEFDELYGYDAVHRLNDMARGTLNEPKTALTSSTFGQCWTLDATGNWQGFREDDTGDGTWDLVQSRTANSVNEITAISETAGSSWVPPAYSAAGNMTTLPQPNDPTQGYTATYDAWNRLVQLEDGEETVSEYAYDGAKRRIVQKSYEEGVLDETRHLYYTQPSQWQVIEERIGESEDAERQFVWGLRYIDDCVLRDRDTNENGTLDERLYACQDGNWNVTALVDVTEAVQERYAYSAYGVPTALSPGFTIQSPAYDWETQYCGYRWELPTGLYHVRNRVYQPRLGVWMQRDPHFIGLSSIDTHHSGEITSLPFGFDGGFECGTPTSGVFFGDSNHSTHLDLYVSSRPLSFTDPTGLSPFCSGQSCCGGRFPGASQGGQISNRFCGFLSWIAGNCCTGNQLSIGSECCRSKGKCLRSCHWSKSGVLRGAFVFSCEDCDKRLCCVYDCGPCGKLEFEAEFVADCPDEMPGEFPGGVVADCTFSHQYAGPCKNKF